MAANQTTSFVAPRSTRRTRGRTLAILAIGAVLAVALNQAVAALGRSAGAGHEFAPLTLPVFGAFTVVGVVTGWVGWTVVTRRARRPRSTLTVLVPLVTLASFIPDVALLASRFIPGTTTAGAVALMTMHLVVVAVAVPAYVLASRGVGFDPAE